MLLGGNSASFVFDFAPIVQMRCLLSDPVMCLYINVILTYALYFRI